MTNPFQFDIINERSEMSSTKDLRMWRNWHTRMIQVHVSITLVRVQVPPSALKAREVSFTGFCVTQKKDWNNQRSFFFQYGVLHENSN